MKAGDILGFCGKDWLSHMINLGSFRLPYFGLSHVGIVSNHDGKLVLFESTTYNLEPCLIMGDKTDGVQAQDIDKRIQTVDAYVYLYSLRDELTHLEEELLDSFLVSKLQARYDMIGAFRSGGKVFSLLEAGIHPENMNTIFCSELCAAAHREVHRLDTKHASYWNPSRLMEYEVKHCISRKAKRLK